MSEATETYLWVVTHPMLWVFLGLTAMFFVVQWLVNPHPDDSDHKHRTFDTAGWMRRHYVAIVFTLGGAAIIAAVWFYVAEVGIAVARLVDRLRTGANDLAPEEAKNLAYGIAVLLGAVVAAATIPFTLLRTWINERSTTAQEQGLITDRINKAVEGLGAEKTVRTHRRGSRGQLLYHEREGSARHAGKDLDYKRPVITELTEPNLEVRVGAIYALERISQDSARDHIQIMEILCAYIRQNVGREDVPLPDGDPTPEEWKAWAEADQEHPRLDVDVALKVIERRADDRKQLERDKAYRLGLERAPLRKIVLSKRDLTGADLRNAELQGANLGFAKLQGAHLWGATLQGANLRGAELQGAHLLGAELQGADLRGAELQGADLMDAKLQGADLMDAKLQGADLMDAKLQGANLTDAKLQGANLTDAKLQGADLRGVEFDERTNLSAATLRGAAVNFVDYTNIPQMSEHLQGIFGDASVTLPGGHGPEHESWPKHWPKFELEYGQFETEWHKWLSDPDNYTPPDPPDPDT